MKINTSSFTVLGIFTLAAIVLLLAANISVLSVESADAQRQGLVKNRTDSNRNTTKTIQLSLTEQGGTTNPR